MWNSATFSSGANFPVAILADSELHLSEQLAYDDATVGSGNVLTELEGNKGGNKGGRDIYWERRGMWGGVGWNGSSNESPVFPTR